MSEPTAYDQYMLELINAERAQAGVQPLADNGQLNTAAGNHSQWMIDTGIFSHTGVNGSSPTDRMTAAGFQFSGAWSDGENIAMTSIPSGGYAAAVQQLNTELMNSPGHRANILNATYDQVGLGFKTGSYQGQPAAFITEDFAHSGSQHFLTGVIYNDANNDHFYEPGEGLSGVTVTAVSSTGAKYSMGDYGSGGYDMALPSGSYTVTFTGANIATTTKHVDIGSGNVKLDLVNPSAGGSVPPSTPTSAPESAPTSEPTPAPATPTAANPWADLLHNLSSGHSAPLYGFNNGSFVFV